MARRARASTSCMRAARGGDHVEIVQESAGGWPTEPHSNNIRSISSPMRLVATGGHTSSRANCSINNPNPSTSCSPVQCSAALLTPMGDPCSGPIATLCPSNPACREHKPSRADHKRSPWPCPSSGGGRSSAAGEPARRASASLPPTTVCHESNQGNWKQQGELDPNP